jgi:hypothetical protein
VARRASSRIWFAHLIGTLGRYLVIGAGVGVVAAGAASFVYGVEAGLIAAGVCVLIAGGAAVVGSMMRKRSLLAAAARVDEQLQFKDRLSTAIELGEDQNIAADPFVTLAVTDGERIAAQADVHRAVPVRMDRSWIVWPVLGAVAVGMSLLVPMLDRSDRPVVDREQVARTRETIASVVDDLEQSVLDTSEPEPAAEEALERMREIERELESGFRTPEDAATAAAAVAQEEAERLAKEAQSERTEALGQELEKIEPEQLGNASALAEALRDADMAEAQRLLREMVEKAESEGEREQLAQDLRRLAEQIRPEKSAQPDPAVPGGDTGSPKQGDEADTAPVDEPGTPGETAEPVNESAASQEPDEPEVQKPAEGDSSSTPDQASREQSERDASEAAERDSGKRDAEELADRLDEVADRVENPEKQSTEKPSPETEQDQPGERQTPDPEQTEPDQTETDRGSPGETEKPQTQEPAEGSKPEGSEQGEQGQQEREPGADEQTQQGQGEENETREGQSDQGDQQGQEQTKPDSQGGNEKPDQTGSETTESQKPASDQTSGEAPGQDESGSEGSEPKPGDETGAQDQSSPGQDQQRPSEGQSPGESPPKQAADSGSENPESSGLASDDPENAGDDSTPADSVREPGASGEDSDEQGGDAIDKALDQLEKLDRRQRDALRRKAQSEQMKKRAEELLGKASPEQRQRLADLASRFQGDAARDKPGGNWNPDTEMFDARPEESATPGDQRAVGSTESVDPPDRTAQGGPSRSAYKPTEVREAAAAAEKAIEGQAIPRRYRDYVRKVYRRFEQQAASRESAPEGRDADAKPAGDSGSDGSGP